MDKRWLAILFIIIIACGCVYFIIQNSSTVGNAIADVGKSSVTLPQGFSVGSSEATSLFLVNKNTDEKIYIEDIDTNDTAESSYKTHFKKISGKYEIIDENSFTTPNGIAVYTAHYIDPNNEDIKNQSIAYYYTSGHTFYLKLSGFDSTQDLDDKVTFVADTTHPDYKKAQDTDKQEENSDLAVNYKREIKSQD